MTFVIDPGGNLVDELVEVAGQRLDKARRALDRIDPDDDESLRRGVHRARKRCKEVRAIARLLRPQLGDAYVEFNELVRDAARELAPIRDAHALAAAFDDLIGAGGDDRDVDLDTVRRVLHADADAATRDPSFVDERVDAARAMLATARRRIDEWDRDDRHDVELVTDGLRRTMRQARRRLARADDDTSDHHVHEWRKSVKHLWYQLRLVRDAAPSVLDPLIAGVDELADALGADHDLAMLCERLDADPMRFGGSDSAARIADLARRIQSDGRRRALRLGATITAEAPKDFARRIAAYVDIARRFGAEPSRASSDRRPGPEAVERERAFLVDRVPIVVASGRELRQGYLLAQGDLSIRVRDTGDGEYFVTIKRGSGAVRMELEWPVSAEQFGRLWPETAGRRVTKTRHRLFEHGYAVELDVFHGALDGLVVAEVEFDTDEELAEFEPPTWFGAEVTDDSRYRNASLASATAPPDPPP